MTNNELFDTFQSAYTEHHITIPKQLCWKALLTFSKLKMKSSKVSFLALLHFSAAFGTIDHIIYLIDFPTSMVIGNCLLMVLEIARNMLLFSSTSSVFFSLFKLILQGSVFEVTISTFYTTLLSSIINYHSLPRHTYV